ncbi:two-component system sensor histidine kinase NtrB [Pseudobacteroides cellulosolvens]|uniref:histidine kinase n=1 Tax=Pseudobacteroides cellulosolvens ATCC 35603 = DSM 2933 TaxID=398512 RepID=A0A0L6JQN2_9FIRM|nr:ATP-binding protein [Pseudobacteroides cellulosolvens]KNY28093.1 multi-sensor signal transduction histidine kinase [Pseudobacteroides cellulosolvens ATCC 35603 = DSM 2933]
MKNKIRIKVLLAILIIAISLLHYFGGDKDLPIHNFYRLFYYIPIILSAFNFGFRGGITASLAVSLIYSPYILLSLQAFNVQAINEFLDVILFFTVGAVTGTLVEKKNFNLVKLDEELKRYKLLENYTNSIIESIRSGVIAVNNDMLVTMVNQEAKNILGTGCECIGQNFTDIFALHDKVKDSVYRAFKEKISNESIELIINKNGKEMIIKVSVYPLNFENVKKGLVIIIDDITELKKMQMELMRNEKLVAIGELSTGVAHEIRNPLGIIKAIEQTMKKELKDNPEALKELDIIDEEVERANKVVKTLMDFGRPPRGEKSVYPLDCVVEDVLNITNKYITQHGVKVIFNKTGDTSSFIDRDLLKQAFVNIIFNAVQAMPDGGTLGISVVNINENLIKAVFEDTGIGINKESIDKIFNPFYTAKKDGTGLGLSIVHRIVKEHGGTVKVSSIEGKGTVFEVMLPVRGI